MDSVKQYLLSVICAAIACGLVSTLSEKSGSGATLMRLITGIFLVFTVIAPIRTLDFDPLSLLTTDLKIQAAEAAAIGQDSGKEAMAAYIKAETEAYILDKATALQVSLDVDVTLDEAHKPHSAVLTGTVSDYIRFRLETILEEDLGISKENQQWNE